MSPGRTGGWLALLPPPPLPPARRLNAAASLLPPRFCLWMMRQLCTSPKTVYRHTSYHKQTKNHWARDDPAFVVVCCALVAATAIAYCLA